MKWGGEFCTALIHTHQASGHIAHWESIFGFSLPLYNQPQGSDYTAYTRSHPAPPWHGLSLCSHVFL